METGFVYIPFVKGLLFGERVYDGWNGAHCFLVQSWN